MALEQGNAFIRGRFLRALRFSTSLQSGRCAGMTARGVLLNKRKSCGIAKVAGMTVYVGFALF
jgi:hypothetical protein